MNLKVYMTVLTTSLQLNNYNLYFISVKTSPANYHKINLLLFSLLTTMIPHKVSKICCTVLSTQVTEVL